MLGVNWLRRNRIIWDFVKDLIIINGEVFNMIPQSEEQAGFRRRLIKEKEAEINESMKRDQEYSDNEQDAKRQKLDMTLPAQIINRIRAFDLDVEAQVDGAETVEECEKRSTELFKDVTCDNKICGDDNVLFVCNFSSSKTRPTAEPVEFVYHCFPACW